ncbi:DNA-binding response regulator, OmpR family, contains REC and winged-helix (wHTH) domain [Raineyella antarctica]|uniref:DNA-binding response regulator, OmpR family, contains REC and winged-helix (WHTH) domain n=1 Tax=Raineyella antarctica TaxID=1577474 RepID=A0A1G6GTI2_9ACTN|nr:response regulator transcription factor [Raineyella antarctica]SDB85213.1 DNA-binding response regulator, OmpR family, contains REC and winged-helix (wHTH) domain [Raineyella antarctica]
MGARVLVVDDEAAIRDVLRGYLEASGYEVAEAPDGAGAVESVRHAHPDVVLLDLGLPDRDGLEVMQQIEAACEAYVLLVTARAEEVDRLVGLRLGADDYITKPFSPREVVARVDAVLRRGRRTAPNPDRLECDGLVVDRLTREVRVDERPVELSALDFDLLAALCEAPGRVFSRRQLLERVWGGDFFGDERIVDVHVRTIRAALADDPSAPRFLATVRGVGYKCRAGSR